MTASRDSNDRLLELLADRALVGLGPREQIELAELLVQAQDVDVAAFERAVAAISLASVGPLEHMPSSLAESIEQHAMAMLDAPDRPVSDFKRTRELDMHSTQVDALHAPPAALQKTHVMEEPRLLGTDPHGFTHAPLPVTTQAAPSSVAPASAPSNVVPFRAPAVGAPSRALAVGGWVAAAACFLLALGAFALRKPPAPIATAPIETRAPQVLPPVLPPPVASQTPAELRDKLLAAQGTARAEWSPTKDPLGKTATGEVVWNKEQQKGVMRFKGLAKNDPTRAQYQLWIFDKTRDDKYPVDGGVFDVDSETGDVIVPIRATLAVNAPVLFAVTLEKPGGVVVSKREHIVVTAKL